MIHGIWTLRSFAILPYVASSRSLCSISLGDIPADLKETAKLKNRAFTSPGYCLELSPRSGRFLDRRGIDFFYPC